MSWLDEQSIPDWAARAIRNPRVVAATICGLVAAFADPHTFVGTLLLVWLVVYFGIAVLRRYWDRMTYPAVPPWARKTRRNLGARMMREDLNAHFFVDRKGFLFERRYWFVATGRPPIRIAAERFEELRLTQSEEPVRVGCDDQRCWWWYQGQFYWENEHYDAEDMRALIRDRERRKERKLQRAHDMMTLDRDPTPVRAPIPQEMRRAVFERDGGRCAECGGTFDLQYDHILPVSLGGATTVENLQILCSTCNREKSDSI